MRSDMYSDQRPSRVPISHFSRRLAATTGAVFFHVFSWSLSLPPPPPRPAPLELAPHFRRRPRGTGDCGVKRDLLGDTHTELAPRACVWMCERDFHFCITINSFYHTTSHVCSLHTFYRNRNRNGLARMHAATHAFLLLHASSGVFSHGPSGRSQPTGSSRRSARAIAVLLPPMSAHASSGPRKTVPLTAPLMAAHSDGGEGRTPTGSHVHISPSRAESTAVTRSPAGSSTWFALAF